MRPRTPALRDTNRFEGDTTGATLRFELRCEVERYRLTLTFIARRRRSVIPVAVVRRITWSTESRSRLHSL